MFQDDTTCHLYNNPTSIKRPVNLIVLLKSFVLNAISIITAISTFRSPLNISVKPFKYTYFNHEFAKQIANDQRDHLNLDRAVARAKENKVISQDLAEPFLNSEFNVPSNVTYNDLSIIAITISSVAIVTVIMKYQKYRKVLAVASLMHQVQKVSTYPTLPSFIYTNAPTTIEPTITTDIHVHAHTYSSYAILALCFVAISAYIYNIMRKPRPALMVDIMNGKYCITCFIIQLPIYIQNCHFHSTLPFKIINVKGTFFPTISFNWGDLNIFIDHIDNSLTLPSTIWVTPWQAYQIQRSLTRKTSLMTQLWACHQKFGMPIQLCDTTCNFQL